MRPQTHYIDLTANQTVSLKVFLTEAFHLRGIIQDKLSLMTLLTQQLTQEVDGKRFRLPLQAPQVSGVN